MDINGDAINATTYKFRNTVFTSRFMDNHGDFKVWDHPAVLKTVSAPALIPPYELDVNPVYAPLPCKDNNSALIGIQLHNVGNSSNPSTPPVATGYTFEGVTVGDNTAESYRNLFDKLRCGIEAYESNLYVHNSTFNLMYRYVYNGVPWGGIGVYAFTNHNNTPYKTELKVQGSPQDARNEFYEDYVGVESHNQFKALVSGAYIATNNTNLNLGTFDPGRFGIALRSDDYLQMDAAYNTVHDCINGIYLSTDPNTVLSSREVGFVYGEYNTITGTPGATYTNQNCAILVDELTPISAPPPAPMPSYTVKVQHNHISDVFNGIYLYNCYDRYSYIYDNTVGLQLSTLNYPQGGIYNANCFKTETTYNIVSSSAKSNDNALGYFLNWNVAPVVGCNAVSTIGRGFQFTGSQNNSFWYNNTMDANQKGYVLDGSIGAQGNASVGNGNQWLGASSGAWTSITALQTYVQSGTAASSPLYVKSGTAAQEDPANNGAFSLNTPYQHTTPVSLFYATGSLAGTNCPAPPSTPYYYRMTIEPVAQDSVKYGNNQSLNAWLAQLSLYRELVHDTTLTDSSAVLKSFTAVAAGTRFGWIVKVENALAAGQTAGANSLLKAPPKASGVVSGPNAVRIQDCAGGDSVMARYQLYYQLYSHFRDSLFDAADTAQLTALAALCPRLNGGVVYQARSLRQRLTGELLIYNDNCTDDREGDGHASGSENGRGINSGRLAKTASIQEYTLLPNPNDGHIQLLQAKADDAPISIKVYNVVGAIVHNSIAKFENNAAPLNLSDIPSGVYYMVLRDGSGNAYTLRFVKK